MIFVVKVYFPQIRNRSQIFPGVPVYRFTIPIDNFMGRAQY